MSLELLHAERDIVRLIFDYATAVDERDFEAILQCYSADGWDDHAPDYDGPVAGYVDWLRHIMPPGPVLYHQVGNVRVDVGAGLEAATASSYCVSSATFPGPDGAPAGWLQLGLRYVDHLTRADGRWRFARRRCRQVWSIQNGDAMPITLPD